MIDFDPTQAAQELWSWLNMTLEKSATAQRTFDNVEELHGAEVYRRLVVLLGLLAPSHHPTERSEGQDPAASGGQSLTVIMEAVAFYEATCLPFAKVVGPSQSTTSAEPSS